MTPTNQPSPAIPRVPLRWQGILWASVLLMAAASEARDWINPELRAQRLGGWLSGGREDFLPYLPLLLLAPLFAWGWRSRRLVPPPVSSWGRWLGATAKDSSSLLATVVVLLLVVAGTLCSLRSGASLQGLPPAYHDEFSYVLQAQTFAAGRFSFPSFAAAPELFDQMHVLNEGRFASRYFPGTGLWMATGVLLGNLWWPHHLAHGLCAGLIFLIGRELSSNGTGLLAGLLVVLSPGVLLFSNLLLAHHPTLVGLLFFNWMFLLWLRQQQNCLLLLAGCGLAFAMLCRPMTAAGYALPYGILFVRWWVSGRQGLVTAGAEDSSLLRRTGSAAFLGVPLLLAGLGLLWQNFEITGSPWVSPYQQYTDIYTPRHVYGFGNVTRGEQHLGPKVLDSYDRWARNLTGRLAAENVFERLHSSLRWTLGIVPLLLGAGAWVVTMPHGDTRWRWLAASIVSLHVVHIPYWFAGIMGWHYVFETAPLWILLFAEGSRRLVASWRATGHTGLRVWWGLLILLACLTNLVTVQPVWRGRLPTGLAELAYAKTRYAQFDHDIAMLSAGKPAIVFILPDASDVSLDYVTNSTGLDGPMLKARLRDRARLPEYLKLFPDRMPLLFDAASQRFLEFTPVDRGGGP